MRVPKSQKIGRLGGGIIRRCALILLGFPAWNGKTPDVTTELKRRWQRIRNINGIFMGAAQRSFFRSSSRLSSRTKHAWMGYPEF